ncbi:hypothetical protein E0W43_05305 [Neisseria meningitidis]|nr:hypothetical protein [Neisseria meningitidis]MBJ7817099.1 hypothetical protein [Neisseria meningitidis]
MCAVRRKWNGNINNVEKIKKTNPKRVMMRVFKNALGNKPYKNQRNKATLWCFVFFGEPRGYTLWQS